MISKAQQRCCYVLALCLIPTFAFAQPPSQPSGPSADLVRQGVAADLAGNYADARKAFAQAIEVASTPQAKAQAMRSMAMSYAFESNCKEAAKYEEPLYQQYL